MVRLHFFLFAFFCIIGATVHSQNEESSNNEQSSETETEETNSNYAFGAFTLNNLYVSSEGNLGIGTTNPIQLLTVNGRILCEEVEVVLDVAPDYVFQKYYTGISTQPEYIMPTLKEVEAYIKTHHHLPEIPSATQMKEDGVGMKEMIRLLLQKVEELTLYTIVQEKEIETLKLELKR